MYREFGVDQGMVKVYSHQYFYEDQGSVNRVKVGLFNAMYADGDIDQEARLEIIYKILMTKDKGKMNNMM